MSANKKPEVVLEHILPSGRGIRFVKLTAKLLREITKRAAKNDPSTGAGMTMNVIDLGTEMQCEIVATCVRGITIHPVKLVHIDARPATEEEAATGKKPPQAVDLEATLLQYRKEPASKIWKALGYQHLTTEGDDHMDVLFEDVEEWKGVLDRIEQSKKLGVYVDPFKGLPSTRMA